MTRSDRAPEAPSLPPDRRTMAARIAAFPWGDTPLGPRARWPMALRTALDLCLHSRFPMFVWWGPARINLYNDAYAPILGRRHPDALGRPAAEVWREIWDVVGPQADAVLVRGEATWNDRVPLVVERSGVPEEAFFSWSYSPIHDDAGQVGGLFAAVVEETGRIAAERALAATQRRLDAALLAGEVGTFQWEVAADRLWGDANFERIFGIPLDASKAAPLATFLAAIHPDDRREVLARVERSLATGAPYTAEYRIVAGAADGRPPRWVEARGRVEHDARGRPARFPGVVLDVTRRHDAEAAVRAAAAREAFLLRLADRLRPLADPADIQFEAARVLGEHLGAGRVAYFEVEGEAYTVVCDWVAAAAGVAPLRGRYPVAAFGPALLAAYRAGRTATEADVQASAATGPGARPALQAIQVGAYVGAPLVKDGALVAGLAVHHPTARAWTAEEVALVEETAERTWAAVERARAEAERAASEARYRALLTSLDAGFCVVEVLFEGETAVDYRYLETNPAFVRQAGFDPAGRTIREVAPTLESHWFATFGEVARTGTPARREERAEALGRWFNVFAYRVDDPALRRVAVLFADVTAARAAAAERERLLAGAEAARASADLERRRLEALLDQLPIGVHLAEAPSGRLVLGNAAVRRIWGAAPASARVEDYSPDYVAHHRSGPRRGQPLASAEWPLARALRTGESVVDEVVEAVRPDGSRRLVSLSATAIRDADGQVVGGVVTSLDVTERERLLAESEAARREAEAERNRATEANQAKAQFLATMSHELRTPLNAVAGYADLLAMGLRGALTADQQADIARIRRANQHLTALVTDLLNFARLEAGQVEYQLAPVEVAAVVADVEALVGPQLAARGLTFAHDACGPDTPASPHVVRADVEKLRQVLVNLLTNAIKFTERGGHVALACETDRGTGVARLRVRDTGRGIAAEKLGAIFEPFVQVDRHRTPESQQGVGLGLAISRDLARGMGGELTVESAPGAGSTFTLTLPLA